MNNYEKRAKRTTWTVWIAFVLIMATMGITIAPHFDEGGQVWRGVVGLVGYAILIALTVRSDYGFRSLYTELQNKDTLAEKEKESKAKVSKK